MSKRTKTQEIARPTRSRKLTNDIIEDYESWLLVDISTDTHPNSSMAVDKDVFMAHEGGRICAAKDGNNIYAIYMIGCNSKQKLKKFHRDVIQIPDGLVCDHKFHYPYGFIDNRRSNLRVATLSENGRNRKLDSRNKSGVTGVLWDKSCNKWRSTIYINGKFIHLGYFDNIDFAIGARKRAESKLFGEFAYKGVE